MEVSHRPAAEAAAPAGALIGRRGVSAVGAPLGSRVRAGAVAWRRSILVGAGLYALLRLVVEIVALVDLRGTRFLGAVRDDPGILLRALDQWDAGWYTAIADQGYPATSHVHLTGDVYQDSAAFPPLYPGAIHLVSHGLHISSLAAATLIALLAGAAAFTVLHRLLEVEFGRSTAVTALVLLATWPAALFLAAPYTEGLLLLFGAGAFLAARSQRWWLAGTLAGLAVVTKIYMVVLVAALAAEYLQQHGWRLRSIGRDAAGVVVPAAVLLGGWMAYLFHLYHQPLRFLTAQASWQRNLAGPWKFLTSARRSLLWVQAQDPLPVLLDLAGLALVTGVGIWMLLRVRRSYGVLMLLNAAVFACSASHDSVDRFTLTVFPLFLGIALLAARRRWLERLWLVAGAIIAVHLVHLFVTRQFVG